MFATLIGTNTRATQHHEIFDLLCALAVEQGFVPPKTVLPIQYDRQANGPFHDWQLEQKGPPDREADFTLAVTAP